MYYELARTKIFLKDYSRCKISDKQYVKFIIYIGKLLSKDELPSEAKEHPLKGNLINYREFHISGDMLVVYKIQDHILYLVRIGSHSQIFG